MELDRTRRIVETYHAETVNHYLRFGWKLVNQHSVEASDGLPARMKYVLASYRTLEDTRYLITLQATEEVNAHLALGWKLLDKFVTSPSFDAPRHETINFVLSWTNDEAPQFPGSTVVEVQEGPPLFADLDPDAAPMPFDPDETFINPLERRRRGIL